MATRRSSKSPRATCAVWAILLSLALVALAGCGTLRVGEDQPEGAAPVPLLRLPAVFTSHMVLQRDMAVPVWGWAEPKARVTVEFAGRTASAKADAQGVWRLKLRALTASAEPAELVVRSGSAEVRVSDVLVGEVWFCSGQSNMEFHVEKARNAQAEIEDSTNHPTIRLFQVKNVTADAPTSDTKASWSVCGPTTVRGFSAVGYFFGRELNLHLQVPVGLIASSWGGTRAEAWTSRPALDAVPFLAKDAADWDKRIAEFDLEKARDAYQQRLEKWQEDQAKARAEGRQPPNKPTLDNVVTSPQRPATLFNGMVAPVVPYAMRGAIWYQGESNADKAWQYRTLLPTMIGDWRAHWGEGDFPFLMVELANFLAAQKEPVQIDAAWPFLREAQQMTMRSVPKVGLASAIDLANADDPNNIYPTNKQDVGKRLALAARNVAYGEKLTWSGPLFVPGSLKVKGREAIVKFEQVGEGMRPRGGAEIRGFAIAGEDQKWVWAKARLDGDTVVLSSPDVASPVAVRYDWANNPIGNLENSEGLPAGPFRTDDWPGLEGPRE